jgi:hypothetical protein
MSASIYPPYRLSFMLPDGLAAFVREGRHVPCLHGCLLEVHRNALVTVDGRSRSEVFRQATIFLRPIARDRPPFTIAATLIGPERRRDVWNITLRADVVFSPGGIEPSIPGAEIENNRNVVRLIDGEARKA